MIIRLIAIAAVTMMISACGAQMAHGYVYPDWLPPTSLARSPSLPTEQDLATTTRALANVGIFENRTSASPGIWPFPPDALVGDN
jgi:hypothetical protein